MTAIHAPPQPPQSQSIDLANVVRTQQAGVWRYLRYLGADEAEVDDLTQETFLAFTKADFTEHCPRQTAGYLRVIARNQLLALRRRQDREINTVKLAAAESVWADAVDADGGLDSYLEALRDCLDELDGRPRKVIDFHYRDGDGREAIAAKLDMKPDGVKSLLRRTRDLLRECVQRKVNAQNVVTP